jgi:FixJ family two-component response regulator
MPVIDILNKTNPVIYVIDPDQKLRSELMTLFKRTGYDAVSYPSAEEFLEAEQHPARFGCIVSEMELPGASGLELLAMLRDKNSRLPLIILTGDPDVGHAVTALHKKVSDYLVKPVIERELINRIKVALRGSKGTSGLASSG